jgi:predicted metal-binding membrane protein
MDMGVASWASMMAVMMLPGAAPAVWRRAHARDGTLDLALFISSYLGVWALVSVAVYLGVPHGTLIAGAVAIAAGIYELTPVKTHFRQCCRKSEQSGFTFGLYCVGSCIGLMLMQAALGVMSIAWMVAIAGIVLAQKVWPAKPAIDVPLALVMVGFGMLILIEPLSILTLALSTCGPKL